MRVIDNNFNDANVDKSTYNQIYNKIVEELSKRITDENILKDMLDGNDQIIIQPTDGIKYVVKLPDSSLRTLRFNNDASAFRTNMDVNITNEELIIRSGIALRPNFNLHQLVHELLHAMSSNQVSKFDENGVTYTKVGTQIRYYKKNPNNSNDLNDYNMPNNLSSDGLNEGITDYLASIITGYQGNYPPLVIVAQLLMSSNNMLLNAYFSKSSKELEMFYTDLEEKQSIITREDIIGLNPKGSISDEIITKLIVGAINYNRAYGKELDKESYSKLINFMDTYIIPDTGSWKDVLDEYLGTTREG